MILVTYRSPEKRKRDWGVGVNPVAVTMYGRTEILNVGETLKLIADLNHALNEHEKEVAK